MARGFIEHIIHQLQYFYRSRGLTGTIFEICRKLFSPIYQREVQYVIILDIESQDAPHLNNGDLDWMGTECVVLESPGSLKALESEVPPSMQYSVDRLKNSLEQGCVVFLARRPRRTGAGKEVVGYSVRQRGVFGNKGTISSDILWTHYTEVVSECRGQRVYDTIARAVMAYCLKNGVRRWCTTVGVYNRPSIRITMRNGWKISGTVERVSVLGGLFVRETPWERIEDALK